MNASSPRLEWAQFRQLAPAAHAALLSLGQAIRASGLEADLIELVNLRASQMNGCAFCTQYHLYNLRALGVPQNKLDLLGVWRDAGLFSERERAALAWTETMTELGREGAPDAAYNEVSAHFSKNDLAFLTAAVAAINAWNRISIAFRFPPPPPPEKSTTQKA